VAETSREDEAVEAVEAEARRGEGEEAKAKGGIPWAMGYGLWAMGYGCMGLLETGDSR
jgi:hypothetical protein